MSFLFCFSVVVVYIPAISDAFSVFVFPDGQAKESTDLNKLSGHSNKRYSAHLLSIPKQLASQLYSIASLLNDAGCEYDWLPVPGLLV